MKCWICNSEANTGEHIVKASDLRGEFGKISQEAPLYYSDGRLRNVPVGSYKSDRFKSSALLCATCNNSLTQPYDIAWEKLHEYLKRTFSSSEALERIDLAKVFPGKTSTSMLHVHLYFAKLFGCRIIADQIPIDITPFSDCIVQARPHPNLFICVGKTSGYDNRRFSLVTPISAANSNGTTHFASWMYIVGAISVNIIYSGVGVKGATISNPWHPTKKGKVFKLAKFKT